MIPLGSSPSFMRKIESPISGAVLLQLHGVSTFIPIFSLLGKTFVTIPYPAVSIPS